MEATHSYAAMDRFLLHTMLVVPKRFMRNTVMFIFSVAIGGFCEVHENHMQNNDVAGFGSNPLVFI